MKIFISISIFSQIWLGSLASEMKNTLSSSLKECLRASRAGNVDPSSFSSQVGL